jgi:plastocyanin
MRLAQVAPVVKPGPSRVLEVGIVLSQSSKLTFGSLAIFALVLAAGCGGGGGYGSTPTTTPTTTQPPGTGAADLTITIVRENGSMSFSPDPASLKVGQKVAWHNSDSITHTASATSGAFDTGTIGPGATSAGITLTVAGNWDYHCKIHPDMVGTVAVTQ